MKYLFILGLLLPVAANCEIYKCQDQNGKVLFSDLPCENQYEVVEMIKDTGRRDESWQAGLKNQKASSVEIIKLVEKGEDTVITYTFASQSDSTNFMKLATKLSQMSVSLMKVIQPKGDTLGQAVINVSSKHNSIFGQ